MTVLYHECLTTVITVVTSQLTPIWVWSQVLFEYACSLFHYYALWDGTYLWKYRNTFMYIYKSFYIPYVNSFIKSDDIFVVVIIILILFTTDSRSFKNIMELCRLWSLIQRPREEAKRFCSQSKTTRQFHGHLCCRY